MIHVSRLNGDPFVLNAELIREVEPTPDTIITLVSGDKILVREAVDEVVPQAGGRPERLTVRAAALLQRPAAQAALRPRYQGA